MNLKKITCWSLLCAGLCLPSYATEYEYYFSGPMTVALTITGQTNLPTKVTLTSSNESWKTTTRKFTNKELIPLLIAEATGQDFDRKSAKLMASTSDWAISSNGFEASMWFGIEDKNYDYVDMVFDYEDYESAYTGTYKETWAAAGKPRYDQCALTTRGGGYIEIYDFYGMTLKGTSVDTVTASSSSKDDTEGNPINAWSLTASRKITVVGYTEDGEIVTGTISYSIKTIKEVID
jgi:hypothetical protein